MSEPLQFIPREPRFVRERFDAIAPHGGEYLIKGFLPRRGVGHLTGPSGSRKSFAVLDWSLRLASAMPVLDHRTHGCGVIYIAAEDPDGLRKRVKAWRQVHPAARSLPFELIGQAPNLREQDQTDDLIAELRIGAQEMAAKGHRLGLVVIDTLATSMAGGDENSGADMSGVLANAARVANELGLFVLIVSHTGKDEARGIRGWSGQLGNADVVIMLSREEGAELSIGRVVKLKNGQDGERFAFGLSSVTLGIDDDGDEITSCVVAYEDAPDKNSKARRKRSLSPGETIVWAAIQHVTDHGETRSAPTSVQGTKPWMKAVTRADVRAKAMVSGFAFEDERHNTTNQRFGRAIQGLIASNRVCLEGELLWLL